MFRRRKNNEQNKPKKAVSGIKNKLAEPACGVNIDGVEYAVNTDFWVWIEIESILSGNEGTECERLAKALTLAYPVLPHDPVKAAEGLLWFYSGGEPIRRESKPCRPICDIKQDFEYIWGAYLAEFGIDLTECRMHWWRFRALLGCLGEENRFSKIIMYRSVDLSKIKDSGLRQFYREMKRRFRLEDRRTDEEKELSAAMELEALFKN